MSREIKFRAWNTVDKIMGKSFTLGQFCGAYPMSDNIDTEGIIYMQYVGLKDKNGVEIYEGDLVKTATGKVMQIDWHTRFASFVINREGWMFSHWFGESLESSDCEVIGNIHQNSNLL